MIKKEEAGLFVYYVSLQMQKKIREKTHLDKRNLGGCLDNDVLGFQKVKFDGNNSNERIWRGPY